MSVKRQIGSWALALGMGFLGSTAMAHQAGDWLVRGRIVHVAPNDDSSGVDLNGATAVSGDTVSVGTGWTLDIDFTRMINDNIGVELLLDTTSEHDVRAAGNLKGVVSGKLLDARVLPPSLIAQYHFIPGGKYQPYVGLGINYSRFLDVSATGNFKQALGVTDLDLDSSWGAVGQLGMDIEMKDDWFFNIDLKYIDLDTEASFNSSLLGGKASIDVDVDPWLIGIGVGKRF